MPDPRLTLVAYGNPLDRKTWSSAPRNIYDALIRQKCVVDPVNALTPNKVVKGIQLARQYLRYGNIYFRNTAFGRHHSACQARTGIDMAGNDHILHVSALHMPLPNIRPNEKHYLYLDFSWALRMGSTERPPSTRFELDVEKLDRDAYAQIHHFFACSEYLRDHLIDYYGIPADRISVIGSGLSTGFIRPSSHQKDYTNGEILFSSKIPGGWEYKGGALLLEGFKIARAKNPRLHLALVGNES